MQTPADAMQTPGARRIVTLAAVASGIGNGFGRFVFPALLPAMRRDLLGSWSGAGFVGTANVGAYLLGALAVMRLGGRLRPRQLIVAGLVLSAGGMFVLAAATGIATLALGMLGTGIGGAWIYVSSPGIARSVVAPARRGLAIGAINAGIGACLVIGTQLGRFTPLWWGPGAWRWVWVIQGAIGVMTLAAVLRWLPADAGAGVGAATPALRSLRRVPAWPALLAGYGLFGFGYIVVVTYLVSSMRTDGGFSATHTANTYVLFGLGTTAGGIVLGRLSDRTGRRTALVLAYAACASCPLLVLTYREPFVSVAAALFGLMFSGAVALVATYTADHAGPAEYAGAFATLTVAFALAQAAGPQVGGYLVDHSGHFAATFGLGSVVLATACLLSLGLRGRTRVGTDDLS